MNRIVSAPARAASIAALLITSFTLSGCFTFTPQVDSMASDLEHAFPELDLDPQIGLKFGRLSLGLARGIAGVALNGEDDHDADHALHILRGIRRVEMKIYENHGELEAWPRPRQLDNSFGGQNWHSLARVRGDDAVVWVLARERNDRFRNLVLVALESEELVLLRISGNISEMLESAVEWAKVTASGSDDDFEDEDWETASGSWEEDREATVELVEEGPQSRDLR